MTQSSFQFGRRAEDQLDLLRALVAQGKVEPAIAGGRLAELTARARAARTGGAPSRRWTDAALRRPSAPADLDASSSTPNPQALRRREDASTSEGVADALARLDATDDPEASTAPGNRTRAGQPPSRIIRPPASALGIHSRKADPERRQRLAAHIAATALPVRFAGTLQAPDNNAEVPLVVVDGVKRPDVADLPRVFRVEALEGDARSRWLFVLDGRGGGCALLVVSVIRPVRCRFRLLFSFMHDRPLLDQVGRAGGFVMTCVDPARERDRALLDAMFIAVPGADVLSVLASTRTRPS